RSAVIDGVLIQDITEVFKSPRVLYFYASRSLVASDVQLVDIQLTWGCLIRKEDLMFTDTGPVVQIDADRTRLQLPNNPIIQLDVFGTFRDRITIFAFSDRDGQDYAIGSA